MRRRYLKQDKLSLWIELLLRVKSSVNCYSCLQKPMHSWNAMEDGRWKMEDGREILDLNTFSVRRDAVWKYASGRMEQRSYRWCGGMYADEIENVHMNSEKLLRENMYNPGDRKHHSASSLG